MKNELLKEVKVVFSLNGVKDTTSIGPDVDRIVMVKDGMGLSEFSFNDEYIYDMPVIIFDEDVIYKVDTTTDWDLIKGFEKTMFRKSCWEIISAKDKKGYDEYEVLYRITEEDYQNALILNGMPIFQRNFAGVGCFCERGKFFLLLISPSRTLLDFDVCTEN